MENNINDSEYKYLINNLLGLNGKDRSIHTKLSGNKVIDFVDHFSVESAKKIFKSVNFDFTLKGKKTDEFHQELLKAKKKGKFLQVISKFKYKPTPTEKTKLESELNFEKIREQILNKIEKRVKKQRQFWKSMINQTKEINNHENIWPLHIATGFVSFKYNDNSFYGPLLLKEVELSFNKKKDLNIKSISNWKFNDKLIFLLENMNIVVDSNIKTQNLTLAQVTKDFDFKNNLTLSKSKFANLFKNIDKSKVNDLQYHPGALFGLFRPTTGKLRKAMVNIIQEGLMGEIVKPNPYPHESNTVVSEVIENDAINIVQIQEMDYTQRKAVISGLLQDTIIWGPPGTGKSQTITNIIANITFQDKTAVVMSEKKSALDVLKKRLGALSSYCLFEINNTTSEKNDFYKSLQKFILDVETGENIGVLNNREYILKDEIEAIEIIKESRMDNTYDSAIELLMLFEGNRNWLELAFEIPTEFEYPSLRFDLKEYTKNFLRLNNIGRSLVLSPRIKHAIMISQKFMSYLDHIEINSVVTLTSNATYEQVQEIMRLSVMLRKHPRENEDSSQYIVSLRREKIRKIIENWKHNFPDIYDEYLAFATDIREAKMLPNNFVSKYMYIARELFDIIVTTPSSTFLTWERGQFDYSIIDEASQLFVETGIPILSLGKTKIISGDTKQMRPTSWFEIRDKESTYQEVNRSLLDYAIENNIYSILLDKNYRSAEASLMSFSSREFYDSKLDVVDDNLHAHSKESIKVYNVDGKWEDNTNKKEAKKVIKTLYEVKDDYNSIIILTFNAQQKNFIFNLVMKKYPDLFEMIESNKLSIKNIENIQGDEAELVIASVGYDKTTKFANTYVTRKNGRFSLNVGISRAKFKMIVIKSIYSNELNGDFGPDYSTFKKWLDYLDKTDNDKKAYANKGVYEKNQEVTRISMRNELIFKSVAVYTANYLDKYDGKYVVEPSYILGSKTIDVAILDGKTKQYLTGIIIDNLELEGAQATDKFLKVDADIEFLKTKHYNVIKIFEIEWILNKEKAFSKILEILDKDTD